MSIVPTASLPLGDGLPGIVPPDETAALILYEPPRARIAPAQTRGQKLRHSNADQEAQAGGSTWRPYSHGLQRDP